MIKVGFGYDVHKLQPSQLSTYITLGGAKIPSDYEIIAHSDGDVVLHAIVDALLGAIGAGDIGDHFPASDNQWQNKESSYFANFALELLQEKGGSINNIDLTIVVEKPKISPYKEEIQSSIASIFEIDSNMVNVKATTNETLDAIGNKEGIATYAVCLIDLP